MNGSDNSGSNNPQEIDLAILRSLPRPEWLESFRFTCQLQDRPNRAEIVKAECLQPNCSWTTRRPKSLLVVDHYQKKHLSRTRDLTIVEYRRYISFLEHFFVLDQHVAWSRNLGRPRTADFQTGRALQEREETGVQLKSSYRNERFPSIWVSPLGMFGLTTELT